MTLYLYYKSPLNPKSQREHNYLLKQGPYAWFWQDVKQVSAETIEHYAKGTVAQVQSIQALQVLEGKLRSQTQSLEL